MVLYVLLLLAFALALPVLMEVRGGQRDHIAKRMAEELATALQEARARVPVSLGDVAYGRGDESREWREVILVLLLLLLLVAVGIVVLR